jgi:hypothetical protein
LKVTSTIYLSTTVTAGVGCGLLYFDGVTRHGALDTTWFWRVTLAEFVIALDTNVAIALLHHTKVLQKFWRAVLPPPQPQLVLCCKLETAAPGNCAICLERLAALSCEHALMPDPNKTFYGRGLLRLPCKHTFHASCAEAWLHSKSTCPMCRQRCDSSDLGRCTRICLRSEEADASSQRFLFRLWRRTSEPDRFLPSHTMQV